MPLAVDQGVGTLVWSPLGWGRLTGKLRRGQPVPDDTRLKNIPGTGPEVAEEYLYTVVDALDELAKETGKTIPQVALNWLLQRPTVSTLILGARNEKQLVQNLDAVKWTLTPDQMAKLNKASERKPIYPYWHQRDNLKLNPVPVL
jgi:aryl-alcohol dehydrogenase-like predicted oxidoreductase